MTKDIIVERLIDICREEGVFQGELPPDIATADLLQAGWMDSMSLVFLKAMVEEEWGVTIPETLFAARLRTLEAVAVYVSERWSSPARLMEPVEPVAF